MHCYQHSVSDLYSKIRELLSYINMIVHILKKWMLIILLEG